MFRAGVYENSGDILIQLRMRRLLAVAVCSTAEAVATVGSGTAFIFQMETNRFRITTLQFGW